MLIPSSFPKEIEFLDTYVLSDLAIDLHQLARELATSKETSVLAGDVRQIADKLSDVHRRLR
jgi:hypothetical protein